MYCWSAETVSRDCRGTLIINPHNGRSSIARKLPIIPAVVRSDEKRDAGYTNSLDRERKQRVSGHPIAEAYIAGPHEDHAIRDSRPGCPHRACV